MSLTDRSRVCAMPKQLCLSAALRELIYGRSNDRPAPCKRQVFYNKSLTLQKEEVIKEDIKLTRQNNCCIGNKHDNKHNIGNKHEHYSAQMNIHSGSSSVFNLLNHRSS